MTRLEIRSILQVMKMILKTRGLTRRELARQMNVSEPTMKRFFNPDSPPSLERLLEVCDILGISFFDLTETARHHATANTFLTSEQDEHFARHPGQFGIFRDLYFGQSPAFVMKKWKISSAGLHRILRGLEKLGLLELRGENRARFKVRGVVRWIHDGSMAKKLVPEQNAHFFAHVYQNMHLATTSFLTTETWMSQRTFEELHRDWQELGRKYRERGLQETQTQPKDQLISVRFAGAVAPFETDWTRYPTQA